MGNSNGNSGKSTGQNVGGELPQWAQVGTDQYNQMNSALQTLPMGAATQTISQGGVGQTGQQAIDKLMNPGQIDTSQLQNLMGQATNPGQIGTQNWQNVSDQAGQGGAASDYLTQYARGDYLQGNPYLDEIINKNAQNMSNQTNQLFAGGGRYGSVAHQGSLSDSIGDMSSNLRYTDFNTQQQNQIGAANALEAAQQGRLGIQGQAAQGIAGIEGQNVNNQLAGTQLGANIANSIGGFQGQNINNQMQGALGAAGLENQGFSNMLGMISQLPTIQGNKIFDAQQQQQAGGQIDQRAQQQLNDLINQWSQGNNEDWARLGGLISAGMGSAGNYGTQTGSQTQPANVGGILGGLAALFSDRSLKENIARVGEKNGFPVYEFNYKGKPERWRGAMVDDVESIMPDAVREWPDGLKTVDYAKLGFPMELIHA